MTLGPAAGARAVADVAVLPLLDILGFEPVPGPVVQPHHVLPIRCGPGDEIVALAAGWGLPLARVWRLSVLQAIAGEAAWCLCCNGTALRIVDARRTWAREYVEFDLEVLAEDASTQSFLWSIARAEAMRARPQVLEDAVRRSAEHGSAVCQALGAGVLTALQTLIGAIGGRARARAEPEALFEQALTVLYRVLFLLFAEARSLVPMWHPVYREHYSVEHVVTTLLAGRPYRGLWQALLAISRLAHAGCTAAELRVTAFNGRLFSPRGAPAFDRGSLSDEVMARAMLAVSTTSAGANRSRIAYRDLDVEQLGAVYEQVLEYEPAPAAAAAAAAPLVRTRDKRKATGTFYTPRPVTSWLVRRTLEPLVANRSADEILRLRIVDPAMGSGAFLVAACRYLAAALEDALIREGRWHPDAASAADRAELRRSVAAQCLFGVDANPVAVQLARLSLWLATLATGKPLSFLDHRLVTGDSLVGATPDDVRRQPSGTGRQRQRADLPLFEGADLPSTLGEGALVRLKLAREPDSSAAVVREKEQTLAGLQRRDGPLGRWGRLLDLWCAGWFWESGTPPGRPAFGALADRLLSDAGQLSPRAAEPLLAHADSIANRRRFLHWPLVFPEVFVGPDGSALPAPGFDAVIANPPWDMVRGDSGDDITRGGRRADAQRMLDFVRGSGVYTVEARAHANRYQLFVERALQLARRGGRISLVLPSGIATDAGAAPLRRHLFDRAAVEEIAGLDNRKGIFAIHRSMRFLALTCTTGQPTAAIRCRFHITQPEELEATGATRPPVVITRRLLSRLSGDDDLGIPELDGPVDLRILEAISSGIPRLGAADGWGARFGRELNATDDRHAFIPRTGAGGRPVIEGKQIEPFRVHLEASVTELRGEHGRRVPLRPRVVYREVASATNRLTLIAAVLPARAVTTHTLMCLKTPLPAEAQHVLCALLNSYVANYLARFRVTTHVTASLMSRLPVPLLQAGDPVFERVLVLSRTLAASAAPIDDHDEHAELQAIAARLYRLARNDFAHVLGTFPLVADATKARALDWLSR